MERNIRKYEFWIEVNHDERENLKRFFYEVFKLAISCFPFLREFTGNNK